MSENIGKNLFVFEQKFWNSKPLWHFRKSQILKAPLDLPLNFRNFLTLLLIILFLQLRLFLQLICILLQNIKGFLPLNADCTGVFLGRRNVCQMWGRTSSLWNTLFKLRRAGVVQVCLWDSVVQVIIFVRVDRGRWVFWSRFWWLGYTFSRFLRVGCVWGVGSLKLLPWYIEKLRFWKIVGVSLRSSLDWVSRF